MRSYLGLAHPGSHISQGLSSLELSCPGCFQWERTPGPQVGHGGRGQQRSPSPPTQHSMSSSSPSSPCLLEGRRPPGMWGDLDGPLPKEGLRSQEPPPQPWPGTELASFSLPALGQESGDPELPAPLTCSVLASVSPFGKGSGDSSAQSAGGPLCLDWDVGGSGLPGPGASEPPGRAARGGWAGLPPWR